LVTNRPYSDVQTARHHARGRNKPRNAEKTLGEIMDVAEALFARYGFEGTSLRQVADGVNMSQPNFYNYFSSKEKLYESVVARSLVPLMELIGESITSSFSEGALAINDDVAYEVIDTFVELLATNRNLAGLLYQESIRGSETLKRISASALEDILAQAALGLHESNKGAWPQDQIPFLVIAWFNLLFGYFASAGLVKGIFPGISDPTSQKALQTQRQFLKNVWDKLMRI
jgi:AcrR family transcriptional regulator